MRLESLVNAIPLQPEQETGQFHDNRTRLILLYRDGDARLDALVVPFGERLKGKKDITTYVGFRPDGTLSATFQDATVEQAVVGSRAYCVLATDEQRFVVPYLHSGRLPERIMPNSFAATIAQCNEDLLRKFVEHLELMWRTIYNAGTGRARLKAIRDLFSATQALTRSLASQYEPLRVPVFDALKGFHADSTMMRRRHRRYQHFLYKEITEACPRPATQTEILYRGMMKKLVVPPLRHAYYCTEDNRVFDFPRSKKGIRRFRAMMDFLQAESPDAHSALLRMYLDDAKDAALAYHIYLGAATIVAAASGHIAAALGFAAASAAEISVSCANASRKGQPTGLVGTLRDHFGLYRKAVSPLDLVSEDYDLVQWRNKDL